MSTAHTSKMTQNIQRQKTGTLHNDTNVGILKTMQASQNTIADVQLLGANIKTEQDGGNMEAPMTITLNPAYTNSQTTTVEADSAQGHLGGGDQQKKHHMNAAVNVGHADCKQDPKQCDSWKRTIIVQCI